VDTQLAKINRLLQKHKLNPLQPLSREEWNRKNDFGSLSASTHGSLFKRTRHWLMSPGWLTGLHGL